MKVLKWLQLVPFVPIYVLAYWNSTGSTIALAAGLVFLLTGHRTAEVTAWAVVVVFGAFRLGLMVGELGPPQGKRR